MKNKFYITTSIAYANAEPHIGYALELIQADVLSRHHKLLGEETWFLTGTDEHGTKIARTAEANHKEPKQFVDEIASKFEALPVALNVANDDFIRTTDQARHWPAVQKLWGILADKDDLYKKNYEGYYCVGHEAFIKKSELVDGVCPIHKTAPETVIEENWFFRLSKYTQEIKKKIETDELKILPVSKKNEILNLLDDAEDVSFSRPSKDLKWGIPVPNDPAQTMYVWADALTNYISALGWDHDGDDFKKFWPADVHLIGKDILRFHAMIWPAMLLSAGIELPKAIYVHGFVTANGEKMSKSVGNVIDPFTPINVFKHKIGDLSVDVLRYFLLREIPSDQDGDFSEEKVIARYNGDLANGLGNLVSRSSALFGDLFKNGLDLKLISSDIKAAVYSTEGKRVISIDNFRLHEALIAIWSLIGFANGYINEQKPWELERDSESFCIVMTNIFFVLHHLRDMLLPFMPETAERIPHIEGVLIEGEKVAVKIFGGGALFPRF